MPLIDKFRNLFRGQRPAQAVRPLVDVIQYDVNPKDCWTVIGELGDGAFGKVEKVCRVDDPSVIAASKCIEIEEGENFEDFLVEIDILAHCRHENVVQLISCYFFENAISMMLEYCGGGAVDGIMIELEKPLNEPQIAYITKYVCRALEYLHSCMVIHRDLKAGNILLTSDGTVKLADFGVSALMKDGERNRNSFVGTPYWMAPEVMLCETFKDQPYDCKSDIWSLGITLIEMAQMDPPNYQVSPMRVVIKIQKSEPPTLDQPAKWSAGFNDFIAHCLVKNPDQRCNATDLMTHPFLKDANDKKPVVQLLLEKNADICEETVIDDGASVDESVADSEDPGITLDYESSADEVPQSNGKQDDHAAQSNAEGAASRASKEETPVEMPKKTFAAPKPPQNDISNVAVEDTINISVPDDTISSTHTAISGRDALSPSGKEAFDILDDLNSALESHTLHDRKTPSTATHSTQSSPRHRQQMTSHLSLDADRPQVPLTELKRQFELKQRSEDDVNFKKPTPPSQRIRQVARALSQSSSGTGSPAMSPSLERAPNMSPRPKSINKSTSVDQAVNDLVDRITGHQPVRLCVNADDDPMTKSFHGFASANEVDADTSSSSRGTTKSAAAEIPQGVVRRNREVVQQDSLADHARLEAERIKEHRKQEDAAIFGSHGDQVHRIAASFTVRPPATENRESTTVHIRSSYPDGRTESPALRAIRQQREGRPISMPNPPRPKESIPHQRQSPAPQFSSQRGSPASRHSSKATSPVQRADDGSNGYNYFGRASEGRLEAGRNGDSRMLSESPIEAPPPEPPIDYDEAAKAKIAASARYHAPLRKDFSESSVASSRSGSISAVRNGNGYEPPRNGNVVHPEMTRKSPQRATVTRKTRKYVVDGVEVTATTLHVLGVKQDYELRRKEMQELKRMQREEARQQNELTTRAEQQREQQERRFIQEKQAVQRTFESDIDGLSRAQKRKIEDLERSQEDELKSLMKRIRNDQDKEIRLFQESLRQEQKMLKHEVDMLPKAQRKDVMRVRKDHLDKMQYNKEADFIVQLDNTREHLLSRTQENHREKMKLVERQFLEQKHQMERSMESALWELEERQLSERHALLSQQFRDVFHLQRTHMLARHQKELEHIRKINQANEENMLRALAADRKRLPKALRNESKTRTLMFKESLRVDLPGEGMEKWAQKIHDFEQKEKRRIQQKLDEYDAKCNRRVAQLVEQNQNIVKELEEIHNEKRKMLMDNEHSKMAEYESEYRQLLADWQSSLPQRKAGLEQKFTDELARQERFYSSDRASASHTN
ncbi:Protein GCK-4 [Aphelenchoides avenae]|nr:Protein GCK-4 [Aphelenchus avenae]